MTGAGAAAVAAAGSHPGVGSRTYGQVLRLEELLHMQERIADVPDTLFFITIHQIYELWFMIVLHELEHARDAIDADDLRVASYHLRRVAAINRVLVDQIPTLETLGPDRFAEIRERLGASSGFQSAQFREIEFLSGCKDAGYLERVEITESERARLERRLRERSLADAVGDLLARRGDPDLAKLTRAGEQPELLDLVELLLDHDQLFAHWRARHALMVERLIGFKRGTGGSEGAQYLRSTTEKRFFPLLWEARTRL